MHRFSRSFLYPGADLAALINFIHTFGFSSGEMLHPLLALDLQLGQTEIGTLLFISSIFSSSIRIPAGIISDRYGRKLSILASAIVLTVSTALFPVASGFVQLVLPFSLWGVGAGLYFTSSNVLIADMTSVTKWRSAYAEFALVGMVASLISPLVTGFLADSFGLVTTHLLSAAFFLLLCLLSLRLPGKREVKIEGVMGSLKSLMDGELKKAVITFAGLNAIHGFFGGIFWPAQSIIYRTRFNLDYSAIGILSTTFTITQILALSQMNRVMTRFKIRWLMVVSTLASAVVVFSYAFLYPAGWLLPLSMFNGFISAFSFSNPMISVILMNSIPASSRGMVQGVIGTVWRAGMASGNLTMGGVWAVYGIATIPLIGTVFLIMEAVWAFIRLPKE